MKKLLILAMILVTSSISLQAFAATATAVIKGTKENSELLGSAHFKDTDEGLQVEVSVFGAAPGLHGIHIHETGSCEDGGNAAGGHFNPNGVKHGFLATDGFDGAHAGDLGNIEVNNSGEGTLYLVIPGLSISDGKYNIEGKSHTLLVARTPQEWEKGLMNVRKLNNEDGMIFMFQEKAVRTTKRCMAKYSSTVHIII